MTNQTTIAAIDELGILRAKQADLEIQEKLLKARLGDLAPGSYEGKLYRLNISESVRETPDKALKAKIAELVAEHLSHQYVTAHTKQTDVRTLKVSARNGQDVVNLLAAAVVLA